MQVELRCSRCWCRSPLNQLASPALDQIMAEGPWFALGDGETWEDRIFRCLSDDQTSTCPRCGGKVSVSEDSLAELSRELLAQW